MSSSLVPSALKVAPLLDHLTAASCDVLGPLLLLPWSCGADASVLGRCGGVLSLAVVDSGGGGCRLGVRVVWMVPSRGGGSM